MSTSAFRLHWLSISIALALSCHADTPAADDAGTGTTGAPAVTTMTNGSNPNPGSDSTGTGDGGTSSSGPGSASASASTDTGVDTGTTVDTGDESTGGDRVEPFGDCVNHPAREACDADATCFVDNVASATVGVCLPSDCQSERECPVPTLGDPPILCTDVDDDGSDECVLSCPSGTGCPPYMQCFDDTLCVWPRHGFAECEVDEGACLEGEACVLFDAPPFSVCSHISCGGDPSLCPAPPPGGSAYVTCGFDFNSDAVSDCMIDCSGGASCPIGMSCHASQLCVWLPGGPLPCADADLGSATGFAVAVGTTFGAGDEQQPQCTSGNADEVAFAWTAPADGFYFMTTESSDYDTVLYVHADCFQSELACNDDSGFVTSELVVGLDAGQTVLIVVDGFGQHGNYVLNIF